MIKQENKKTSAILYREIGLKTDGSPELKEFTIEHVNPAISDGDMREVCLDIAKLLGNRVNSIGRKDNFGLVDAE